MTTRTSRITLVTPRRTYLHCVEDPNQGLYPNGGWWGYAQRRHRQCSSSLSSLSTPLGHGWQEVAPPPVQEGSVPAPPARLHHRPSSQPTVTGTSKQNETRGEVTTSARPPAASNLPWRTRPAWVNPA